MSVSEKSVASVLRAEGLTAGYGEDVILDGLSVDIPKGQFTVIAGPNGCGKSTLLKALSGALPCRKGRVLLHNKPVSGLAVKSIARRVGVLSQSPATPEGLTVQDLVRQGRYPHRGLFSHWSAADESACEEALKLTGLKELALRPVTSLSGGQKQRAWIAMTLAQMTKILLLDEPTTYLDVSHQVEVLGLLRHLVETNGSTIVCVLHDINQAAQYADNVVLMKDGRIVAEGRTGEVLTGPTIQAVFGVAAHVIANPLDGTPLMLLDSNGRSVAS